MAEATVLPLARLFLGLTSHVIESAASSLPHGTGLVGSHGHNDGLVDTAGASTPCRARTT